MAFDFPSSPTNGQIFTPPGGPTYVWQSPRWLAQPTPGGAVTNDTPPAGPLDGQLWWQSSTGILFCYYDDGNSSQWVQVGGIAAAGAIVERFYGVAGSTTWTKPAGLRFLLVEGVGAGGAGGGAIATAAAQYSAGSGGGAGGYGKRLYTATELPASVAITIGAGGAINGSGTAGAAGGTTTFGALATLNGGIGGGATGVLAGLGALPGGAGQGASGFTINGVGAAGLMCITNSYAGNSTQGQGASALFGRGGDAIISNNRVGQDAAGYGAGGSGGANGPSQTTKINGAGAPACLYLTEFY